MDIRKVVDGQRQRRAYRVRKKVRGSAERPRLCINRSLTNFGCQVIDDASGLTIVSATTRDKDVRGSIGYGGNCEAAKKLGKIVAERAIAKGIKTVCLDRGSCKYHGRVAAFADAAREAGLEF
ncbi:50S ribosomal protein L18 [Pirellula sp. SH-Sr6A]|uniref:50S ribosomal protein L18 n=1 Tax=Pirellula sp. SH-Sr6A TaxID=1632865 RepID=UPI00078DCE87|nr:50S ribosomal protein L18 [Pirellula sp. SH-Sr6A]AMV34471.1 50S ribosomal protein L18 [Pirellula sp. SH-Sr6A]